MKKEDTILKLWNEKGIHKNWSEVIWDELEKQNKEFFIAYNFRMQIRDQLVLLQYLAKHCNYNKD